jgi:hypothetical protein
MTQRTATWGSTVLFRSTFLDEDENEISPTVARITFRQGKKSITADMDQGSGGYEYRLDTSQFKPGMIFWAIDASGDGDTKVAEDGQILLEANEARRAAA